MKHLPWFINFIWNKQSDFGNEISMIRNGIVNGMLAFLLAVGFGQMAEAASVGINPSLDSILVGEFIDVEFSLNLGLGEEASAFEGSFGMTGLGAIADVTLSTVGGPTWDSAAGNIVGDEIRLSTTSTNQGGVRSVGIATIMGLSSGTFEIFYLDSSFAAADSDFPPFLIDVPLTNTDGELLAAIQFTDLMDPDPMMPDPMMPDPMMPDPMMPDPMMPDPMMPDPMMPDPMMPDPMMPDPNVIPEPSTFILLASGLTILGLASRRKSKKV